jgi:hypothetical protein
MEYIFYFILILKIFVILLLDNSWEHKKFLDLIYTKFLPT